MPNLFDNLSDDTRLKDALRVSLKDFDTVDVATEELSIPVDRLVSGDLRSS